MSDSSVLKYYQLNINYPVNILSECLRIILIDCSQLSKTCNYNVLFGSSTRDRHARYAYISGRSENNIKCVVHDDLRRRNRTTVFYNV